MKTNILKMIEQAKVEWKPLGEVGELIRGNGLTKKDLLDDGVPAIHYGQIYTHFGTFADKTKSFTSPEIAKKLRKAQYGDVLIAGTSENVQDVMKPVGWFGDEIVFSGDMFAFRPNEKIMTKYLTYMLQTTAFAKFKEKYAQGTKVIRISSANFLNYQIPIPSLELQKEIVKILDIFTELNTDLTTALETEHSLRTKQYQYYRDLLLSENELAKVGFEWKYLKDIALDFGRGKSKHRPRNDEKLYGGNIPFVQTGDIRNSSKYILSYNQTYSDFGLSQSKLWKKGTLCITIAANIAETAILDFDACFPDSIIGFVADPNKANQDYVYYLLQALKSKLQSYSVGSAQENINLSTFDNILFPIPPLDTQAKIVAILDKFDRLTSSITEGLPKEIELRRKQYEYYRELLLNFPKV